MQVCLREVKFQTGFRVFEGGGSWFSGGVYRNITESHIQSNFIIDMFRGSFGLNGLEETWNTLDSPSLYIRMLSTHTTHLADISQIFLLLQN